MENILEQFLVYLIFGYLVVTNWFSNQNIAIKYTIYCALVLICISILYFIFRFIKKVFFSKNKISKRKLIKKGQQLVDLEKQINNIKNEKVSIKLDELLFIIRNYDDIELPSSPKEKKIFALKKINNNQILEKAKKNEQEIRELRDTISKKSQKILEDITPDGFKIVLDKNGNLKDFYNIEERHQETIKKISKETEKQIQQELIKELATESKEFKEETELKIETNSIKQLKEKRKVKNANQKPIIDNAIETNNEKQKEFDDKAIELIEMLNFDNTIANKESKKEPKEKPMSRDWLENKLKSIVASLVPKDDVENVLAKSKIEEGGIALIPLDGINRQFKNEKLLKKRREILLNQVLGNSYKIENEVLKFDITNAPNM